MKILGVMTGTSCDGLDAVCVTGTPATGFRPLWNRSCPFPRGLRDRVLVLQKPGSVSSLKDLLRLERDYSLWIAKTLQKWLRATAPAKRPDLIACHGQTVAHFPREKPIGVTLQLLEPSILAQHTGISVASHFRQGDLAAGGEGAPLVPLFHKLLWREVSPGLAPVAFLNLGGIANFSVFGKKNGKIETMAFDTGPANAWIDRATSIASSGKEAFDRNGKRGLSGKVNKEATERLMRHPFFKLRPPKSTGRDDFTFEKFQKETSAVRGNDLVATATEVTARSVADAFQKFVKPAYKDIKKIVVCGGGRKNPYLLSRLARLLPGITLLGSEVTQIEPELMEPMAFAYFGALSLEGKPLGGNWTGAKGFGPPARFTPGQNWKKLISMAKL